jgi:hypothetical protein
VSILIAAIAAFAACTKKGNPAMRGVNVDPSERPLSWHSPRVLDVQKKWEKLYKDSLGQHSTKESAGVLKSMLDDILKRELSEKDLRDLAGACGELPIREQDRAAFANAVLERILVVLVNSGDRDDLVALLSTRFLNRLGGFGEIEGFLSLFPEMKKTIKYPIVVLGDAYAKCKSPEVRHDIASAIRRGFSTMRIPDLKPAGVSDADYLSIAMKWYGIHKDELVPNIAYLQNEIVNGSPNNYDIPLFTWKSLPAK